MTEEEPHDSHVQLATKLFRSCGFTLAALQYPRCAEALSALKKANGLADNQTAPVAWGYFPNAHMRDNWRRYYEPS
jgi:hypothetical protein